MQSKVCSVECAVSLPLAGHAVNPQAARAPRQRVGCHLTKATQCYEPIAACVDLVAAANRMVMTAASGCDRTSTEPTRYSFNESRNAVRTPCTPTDVAGPCPLTIAGPSAAWMPPRSLQAYLQRVPRWWAGKDPAAKSQISCLRPEPRVSQPAAKVRPFALQQTGVP